MDATLRFHSKDVGGGGYSAEKRRTKTIQQARMTTKVV